MIELAGPFVFWAVQALIAFLLLVGAASFIALWRGCTVLRRTGRGTGRDDSALLLKSPMVPAVSVLAVVRDASVGSREFVKRLVNLHFGRHEVILVLDGVTTAAVETWAQDFKLMRSGRSVPEVAKFPANGRIREVYDSTEPYSLTVIDKERGGEAEALNAAVRAASSPWMAFIGPECEFEAVVLLRMIRPALEMPDATLGVCAVAPAPARGGLAGQFGALESLRAWLARAAAFSGWDILAPIPGTTVLLKREAVVAVGGFRAGVLEMCLRLHALARATGGKYSIAFVPEPISYARGPRSGAELRAANAFDQWEIARSLAWRKDWNRGLFPLGMALPGLYAVRFLRPLAETVLYVLTAAGLVLGLIDLPLAGVVLFATAGVGILISMAAAIFRELAEKEGSDPERLARLFLSAIPENLGYRQLRNLRLVADYSRHNRTETKSRGQ